MSDLSVVVVDDEPLFSALLTRTLEAEDGFTVVGTAGDGESAIDLARAASPDVILMDIDLPGELDGIDASIKIKDEFPDIGIVILSAHGDRRYVESLPIDEVPGWAYMLKQSVPDINTLVRAIQGSSMGMVVLDPAVVTGLRPRRGSALERLTPRLREVLALIAQGFSNGAIAEELTLTQKSVETYTNTIYQELGLSGEPGAHARVMATLMYLEDSQDS